MARTIDDIGNKIEIKTEEFLVDVEILDEKGNKLLSLSELSRELWSLDGGQFVIPDPIAEIDDNNEQTESR